MSAPILVRRALWTAMGISISLSCAGPAVGQQASDEVVALELAYRAATSQYRATLDAWNVVEKQWNDALEEHVRARRSGDEERRDAALRRALDVARELDRLERRVAEQGSVRDAAGAALLAALDERLERLAGQLLSAPTTAERARITALIRDAEYQQAEVEAAAEGPAVRAELVYYPSIQYDPRDNAETLSAKAHLLHSKADQADAAMAQIDRDIERLERQLQRSRNVRSLVTGVERFGDLQVPLGAPNRPANAGDMRARPDSTGVARPEATPEQRLQELRLLRVQVEAVKQQFLERAAGFERLVRRSE